MKRTPVKTTDQPMKTPRKSPAKRAPTGAATKRAAPAADQGSSQTDPAVAALLEELDHPLKQEIEAVRQILLGVDPSIREAVKWNAPSFRTTDFFATFNLRSRDHVQLVFHTGAKVKASATTGITVADPDGLLKWLAKDRCLVTLGEGKDIKAKRASFEAVVREWIRWL